VLSAYMHWLARSDLGDRDLLTVINDAISRFHRYLRS